MKLTTLEGPSANVRREVAAHYKIEGGSEQYDHLDKLSKRARAIVEFNNCSTCDVREFVKDIHDDDLTMVAMMDAVQKSAVKRKLVASEIRRRTKCCGASP